MAENILMILNTMTFSCFTINDFINKLIIESKKKKRSFDKNLDIADIRFVFSVDFSCTNNFTSRLALIQFPNPERNFSSMTLMEKMKCSELELLNFEAIRVESDPEYVKEETARLKKINEKIESYYFNLQYFAKQELPSRSLEPTAFYTTTGKISDIHLFYMKLIIFLEYSYFEMQDSLKIIEGFPAWDQDLIKDYRSIIEKNIELLNKIIFFKNTLCEDDKTSNKYISSAFAII